jgi:hypothetical protein
MLKLQIIKRFVAQKTPISCNIGVFLFPLGHAFVVFCTEFFGSFIKFSIQF